MSYFFPDLFTFLNLIYSWWLFDIYIYIVFLCVKLICSLYNKPYIILLYYFWYTKILDFIFAYILRLIENDVSRGPTINIITKYYKWNEGILRRRICLYQILLIRPSSYPKFKIFLTVLLYVYNIYYKTK